jgi:hypothetical protein
MGEALHPVLLALRAWGETWAKPADKGVAIRHVHLPCGQDPGLGPTCQRCGQPMRRSELSASLSEGYEAERRTRLAAFKGGAQD